MQDARSLAPVPDRLDQFELAYTINLIQRENRGVFRRRGSRKAW